MTRYHQRRVAREVRLLYAMREANSIVGTPRHRMLATARRHMDEIVPDLTRGGLGIPAFLLGGAALSAVASVLQTLLHDVVGRIALLGGVLLLTVGAFWCIIMAAAVTRRRTRLVLDLPLRGLWKAIGSAGRVPQEQSKAFVLVATIFLVLGWLITPLLAALVPGF